MPDQREPGAPIMNIRLGSCIEIDQSWYDYSKLREEIQDDGTLVPFPAHVHPASRAYQLQERIPGRDS